MVMKIKPQFVLLLLFASLDLLAQSNLAYSSFLIPEALKENAHEVIRSEVMEFSLNNEKEGDLTFHTVITILDNKSSANLLVVGYDKETKIDYLEAKIYDSVGKLVRKVKKSEIRDVAAVDGFSIYRDDRMKYIELTHHSLPFTVEYEYRKKLKGTYFFDYPDWQAQRYNNAVEQSKFVVSMPTGTRFFYEALNTNSEPLKQDDGKRETYTWEVKNLPAIEEEDFSPVSSEIFPMVNISPDVFQFDKYQGSMASWKEFGAFLYQLYLGKNNLPDEMIEIVHQLTDHVQNNKEKINILYRYLQENMRYVSVQLGIGGFQPFDAEYVYRNKYGDCKALSNFMKSMLEEADIEAYPVIIKNGPLNYDVKESFATSSFNHVIVYVPSEDYWLECTSSNTPPNFIGYSNSDRNVLLVTPEGGKLVRTPRLNTADNLKQNTAMFTLEPDGSAVIEGNSNYTGAFQEHLRNLETYASGSDREEWFIKNSSIPTFQIQSLQIQSEKMEPKSKMDYQLDVRKYCSKAGKRFFVPLNTINPFNHMPAKTDQRKFPIVLNRGYVEQDVYTFKIPEGYEIESLPETMTELKNDFASYTVKLEKQDGQLIYSRSLEVNPIRLPAASYDEFRAFFIQVSKLDNMKMVLGEKRT
ncbi:MAG: hypothetical protein DHS20C18_01090 [Saprospiraceae bacterium]|nr:MAG: hypothetical protein DHS20C18_01090 [Saprospiraceae bacterium]